jgi:hypothetical protein
MRPAAFLYITKNNIYGFLNKNYYRWRCNIRNFRGMLLTNEKYEILNIINYDYEHEHKAFIDTFNALFMRFLIKRAEKKMLHILKY